MMLRNPKWDKKKPTLNGFIEWLKTKNGRKKYVYYRTDGTCAVDQYLASCNIPVDTPKSHALWREGRIAAQLNEIAYGPGLHTFSALLKRAEAIGRE